MARDPDLAERVERIAAGLTAGDDYAWRVLLAALMLVSGGSNVVSSAYTLRDAERYLKGGEYFTVETELDATQLVVRLRSAQR